MKRLEFLGVFAGILGAFLVANGVFKFGYILFFISSLCLVSTAFKQRNWNLTALQGVFLIANCNGLFTFFMG